jgi:hypothetical protein
MLEEPEIFLFPNVKRKGKLHLISSTGITSCGRRNGRVNTHTFQRVTLTHIINNEICKTCRNTAFSIYKKWLMKFEDDEEIESIFFDIEDATD